MLWLFQIYHSEKTEICFNSFDNSAFSHCLLKGKIFRFDLYFYFKKIYVLLKNVYFWDISSWLCVGVYIILNYGSEKL